MKARAETYGWMWSMGRSIDSPIVCCYITGILCWTFQAIYYQDSTAPANHVDCTLPEVNSMGKVGKWKLRRKIWPNSPEASHGNSHRLHIWNDRKVGAFRDVDNTWTKCLEPSKILISVCTYSSSHWMVVDPFYGVSIVRSWTLAGSWQTEYWVRQCTKEHIGTPAYIMVASATSCIRSRVSFQTMKASVTAVELEIDFFFRFCIHGSFFVTAWFASLYCFLSRLKVGRWTQSLMVL